MIIYNVTVKVDNSIAGAWLDWMKKEHIPDLMRTGLFLDYRLSKLLEQDETEGITYTVQYFCESLERYHTYIAEHAQRMRDEGINRFGSAFVAFRTIMEVED